MRTKTVLVVAAVALALAWAAPAHAQYGRQYYSSWTYNSGTHYYYASYYYRQTPAATNYSYHYAIYYPTRPQYVYYYNPANRVFWGRYDLDAKGYSLLEEKDRKEKLEDIDEKAFPKPGEMPFIPGSKDERITPPEVSQDLKDKAKDLKDADKDKKDKKDK
jgi:hypothetical protein